MRASASGVNCQIARAPATSKIHRPAIEVITKKRKAACPRTVFLTLAIEGGKRREAFSLTILEALSRRCDSVTGAS